MLNKNQSKKRNSWKYAFVLPLLGAFVFFFQVKVVAQEKIENSTKINNLKAELHITSKSTSKELNSEKDFFKEEFNLEINFSEIKTNTDNEIIAIKVELINKEGITKENRFSGENPINPFNVFAEKIENNKIKFGFSTTINQNDINHFDLVNALKRSKKENKVIVKEINSWTIDNYTIEKKEYLIIINGQKQSKNNKIKIPLDEEILSENALKPEDAIKKYGKEGENGAVEISTINSEEKIKGFEKKMKLHNKAFENLNKKQEADTLSFDKNLASFEKDIAVFDKDMESLDKIEKENNNSREVKINKVKVNKLKYSEQAKADAVQAKIDAKQAKKDAIQAKIDSEQAKKDAFQIKIESKPIIIINGKRTEASMEDINKLDPNLIQSMNILKGKNATEKYGKNGKNGAIEIITKENLDILKSSNKKVK